MLPSAEVEELEIRLLLQAIHARYGHRFQDYAEGSMRRRVRAALARSGLPHLGELQHRLLSDPQFFASVLDDLTVRVSDLFRDPSFYRALREKLAPVLRTYPVLKVWHAGCASGEEAYSTAILLSELNLYERAQIYATDMSVTALEAARQGVFSEDRAAAFAENYRESGGQRSIDDYFSRAYGRIAVREGLRKNIVFFQHDLACDYALGEMQLVFCRNVLIYLGKNLRTRALTTFSDCLTHGGFLCLGMNEGLPGDAPLPFADFLPRERIYRRLPT